MFWKVQEGSLSQYGKYDIPDDITGDAIEKEVGGQPEKDTAEQSLFDSMGN